MDGFGRQVGEEARGLRERLGFRSGRWLRGALIHILVLGSFGFLLPWAKGVEFLDSVILGAYACLGVVFVAPAAAAPLDDAAPGRALARIAVCVAYGCAMSWTMLAGGLLTVYIGSPFLIGLDPQSLAASVLFGVMLSAAAASMAVWIALRISAIAAKTAMRLVFLGLLLLFFWYARWLPDVALKGAGIATVVTAAFVALLMVPGTARRPEA